MITQPYGQQPRSPSFAPDLQYRASPGQGAHRGQPLYGQQAYRQGQPHGRQPRSPSGAQSWPRRHKVLTVLGSLVVLIIVIGGIASATGKSRQAGDVPAGATITPSRTATPSRTPAHHAVSTKTVPAKAPVTAQAAAPPPAATAPAPAASTPAPAKTAPGAAPSRPAAMPSASCRPLSDEGTCYEPGEYCRYVDRGMSGVAGDGKAITCEDNDGWRWEPS